MGELRITAPDQLIIDVVEAYSSMNGVLSSEAYEVKEAAAIELLIENFREAILANKSIEIRKQQKQLLKSEIEEIGNLLTATRSAIDVEITQGE
jgi:hypothetical protein